MECHSKPKVVCIGAGPAGLTAGYLLSKRGVSVEVVEADPEYVGGISRTVQYKGFRFDIGGHRFFSKSQQVEDLWSEILPEDMLVRPRLSRIYYRGKFFSYPLKASDAVTKLGILESFLCVLSYFRAALFPVREPKSFEDWVCNQFGRRLFSIFFKTYTEKVWGMSCSQISADWAAQRIKNLSLGKAILHSLGLGRKGTVKTLIESFRYPRLGPGMMWEAFAQRIRDQGGTIQMGTRIVGLNFDTANGKWTLHGIKSDGSRTEFHADHVVCTAPMKDVGNAIEPRLSDQALTAANGLRYRDFLTVVLISKGRDLFPDNWLYIHEPSVKVGRIQNFKAWSSEMVPGPEYNCYGLEYFCFENDKLWSSSDSELIDLAKRELEQIGLGKASDFFDGYVVRQAKAYPVYDEKYSEYVDILRKELEEKFPTIHLIGRSGMHQYNNQDHAMMTAMLTAENILAGKKIYDVWGVNQDAEYLEEDKGSGASGLRSVPTPVKNL